MASIINSISFKNFFNYYGDFEDNTYKLEEGINIIVADNGAGKSKFFNAFLWLFYDQILDSDTKQKINIKNAGVKIISDKAKNETAVNDYLTCGVCVEYTSGTRYKYQIIKSFTATRLDENITDENSWQFVMNELEVNRTELVLHKYKPVYDENEKKKIIDKLIMPAFRQYSFLQGEEVDDIIDFSKKESIEKAVENLTDIKKYEQIHKLLEEFKEKAFKDVQKQIKANDSQNERFNNAVEEKEKIEQALEQEQLKLKQFNETLANAEAEKNELDKLYANAEKRKEFDDKLKPLRKRLREKQEEFETFLDRINNRFFDGNFAWIALGFEQEVEKFRELNDEFIEKRYEKKALKNVEENPNEYFHFLPENSPDSVSLQNMIDDEHCYVCNREAKEGTPEYKNLVKLKNRTKDKQSEKPFVKNDLKNFFGDLQINAQPFYNKLDGIKDSIIKTKEKEVELKDSIERLKKRIKSLEDDRNSIMIAGHDQDQSAKDVISSYNGAVRRISSAENKINDIIIPKINQLKKDLKLINEEVKSLNKSNNIPDGYNENYEVLSDLEEAASKAKDKVFDGMINLLEEHANIHFKNLIKNNDLSGGILKFEKNPNGSINFNYLDSKGNSVYGSSEGFQRMKKFSVVMAIISANNAEYNYPLLADAPISAFGEGFTEGFFEAIGDVFPQSIVLVKELYKQEDDMKINELGKRLLKDERVKTMYVNHVPENAEQIELVTTKTKLK
ncbi:DNA sulfur modification protein DndD [Psychroflexus salarius]|uniref:DNA sulfur modification protein DndD n=1 Tax=Psychroflexus salarius TaxID=1155689 RepID=A0A1M4WQE5_9FLAO|nr:AAA family ATPase [Psychroflexus salarius]SHE83446.1 DNA sulfur modification protein DndD [Psychroflexus salarius]